MQTKMKTLFLFLQLFFFISSFTASGQQSFTGKIENATPDKPAMDIVLFMFGLDNPVKVGTVDEKGNISIDFPEVLPDTIAPETKEIFSTQLPYALFFSCPDITSVAEGTVVYKGGYFSLSHQNRPWAATLFPVSDIGIIPWLEDRYYQSPIMASFYEVIYCEQNIDLTTLCKESISYTENTIDMEYQYTLRLKKGFNLIEYKIEAIQETGIPDTSPIPSVVTITNADDMDATLWHAKYYYSQFN